MERLRQLIREVHRRSLWQVVGIYLAGSWVAIQVVREITLILGLPDWFPPFAVGLLVVGFPIVVATAFVQEGGPVSDSSDASLLDGTGRQIGSGRKGATKQAGAVRGLFTWRNAIAGGVLAFALWGVVAAGWVLFGGGPGKGEGESVSAEKGARASLAVLPFDNLSGTDEAEPFVKGIHDDLLTRLSNISGLKVISRTSVLPYRETELSLPAIADSLGVAWIVEGGVQQSGDRVQVNAQLIQAEEDAHRWAESYRRELTTENLFDVQSELTKKIARSLEAELTPEETERVERRPTGDLEAYRLYVQGRGLLAQRAVESIQEATASFEQALRQDSTYALAWAGLADARVLQAIYDEELSKDRRQALVEEARASARRAWKLGPDLAEAWTALGAVHIYEQREGWGEGNGPVALRQLRRAVALKPSYAHAQQWLAELYLLLGRPERGLEHASLAVELDPEHAAARQILVRALLANDRNEEAWSHFQKYPQPHPDLRRRLLYHTGRWNELRASVKERLTEADGDCARCRFYLARIAALRADTAAARAFLPELREDGAFADMGFVHAALGDEDRAFRALRQVDHWGFDGLELRYLYPDVLDPLREDPRYGELIREMNRSWGLTPDGSLPDSVDTSFEPQADG